MIIREIVLSFVGLNVLFISFLIILWCCLVLFISELLPTICGSRFMGKKMCKQLWRLRNGLAFKKIFSILPMMI